MNRKSARFLLLFVTIIWGSGYVVNDMILGHVNPYQLLTTRFFITFFVLSIIFRKSYKLLSKKVVFHGSILGSLLYFAFVLQTVGLQYTTPSKNAFLTATSVVMVPLFSFLISKQTIKPKTFFAIFSTLLGVGFMSLNGFGMMNLGDMLSLLCAVFFALQLVYLGKYVKLNDPRTLMLVQMGVASFLGISINLIRGDVYTGGIVAVDLSLLYLALFGTLFSFGMQSIAQQYASDTETSLILSLESFWGMLFSAVLLKESISNQMIVGASLILLGIFIGEIKWNPNYLQRIFRTNQTQMGNLLED
ncbi:DMT family transporter [Lacticigenium naphthae]|uniref:DMT family transporter n=1 Tax=Lacticigenium naphthae TaxID=515351 RepID=UPI0003F98AD1|nr:DMT family transporter [Lacticigenium naphthae]